MEVLITVFNPEFHYYSLAQLLHSFSKLHPDLKMTPIVVSLIEALVAWVNSDSYKDTIKAKTTEKKEDNEETEKEEQEENPLFELLWEELIKLIKVKHL